MQDDVIDLNKEVHWGKLKLVKKMSLFRNSKGITIWAQKLQQAVDESIEGLGQAVLIG